MKRKYVDRPKGYKVDISFSDEEKKKFLEFVAKTGKSKGAWVRIVVLKAMKPKSGLPPRGVRPCRASGSSRYRRFHCHPFQTAGTGEARRKNRRTLNLPARRDFVEQGLRSKPSK